MTDILNQAIKLQTLLEQYDSKAVKGFNEMLEKTLDSIILKLQKEDLQVIGRQRLEAMLAETMKLIEDQYTGFNSWLKEDQEAIAKLAYETSAKSYADALDTGIVAFSKLPNAASKRILDENRYILGNTLKSYETGLKEVQKKEFRRIIAQGVTEGTNTTQIAKNLTDRANALMNNAKTIANTVIGNAQQEAYTEAANQFEAVIDYAFSEGVLDSRTSPICQKYTGTSWKRKKGESFKEFLARIPNKPKRHYNCRSQLVFQTKDQHQAMSDIDKPAVVDSKKKTVKHRDGTTSSKYTDKKVKFVSADTKYDEFFEAQSVKFKKAVLGEKRYKLYKEGRLKISQVRDIRTNSYKTIEELEDLINS